MQILKARGPLAGFWAVGIDRILSEVIDSGEHWEGASYRIGPHVHRHWEIGYVVEGITRMGVMGGREIFFAARFTVVFASEPESLGGTRLRTETSLAVGRL